MPCQILYKLFFLSRVGELNTRQLTSNYRRIFALIHPDKCSLPMANEASTNLSQAHRIPTTQRFRNKYFLLGMDGLGMYNLAFDQESLERTHLSSASKRATCLVTPATATALPS